MKIKTKLLKWISMIGAFGLVVTSSIIFANDVVTKSKTSTRRDLTSSDKTSRTNNVNYSMKANPIVELSSNFDNIYFSTLDQSLSSPIGLQLKSEIINSLKSRAYWDNNLAPNDLDFEVISLIENYKNPLLNINKPAIKITPIIGTSKLSSITITLDGFKPLPTDKTYPLDIVNKNFTSTNTRASLIYNNAQIITENETNKFVMPSSSDVKNYLLEENYSILKSIFVNLPTLGTTTNVNDGQFILGEDGISVTTNNAEGVVNGQYTIFNYDITLNCSFDSINGYVEVNTSPTTYSLDLYLPNRLLDGSENQFTTLNSVINVNDSQNTALDFDKQRTNDPTQFKNKILELIKTNSTNLPDLNVNEIDVKVASLSNGIYYFNQYGYIVYNITIKRVNYQGKEYIDEQHWINQDVVFTGFKNVTQTIYNNTITVTNVDKYASEYATLNENEGTDILSDIATTGSPLIYSSGSHAENIGTGIASLFKSERVSVNYNNASYNDRTGTISNIQVSIYGYYDKNNIYQNSNSNPKYLTLTINGFKTNDVTGVTTIRLIDAPTEYIQYPAQSFAALSSEKQKLTDGWLPTNIDAAFQDQEKQNEIKNLISNYTINIPDVVGNEPSNWMLRNIKIDNFTGSVTGEVFFPYYYDLNSSSEPIIKQQSTVASEQIWLNFTIQGFSEVPGQTTINSYSTNYYLEKDGFDVLQQIPTSQITITEFESLLTDDYIKDTIKFWVINQAKVISNRWSSFQKQIENEEVGIQNIQKNIDVQNNIVTLSFDFYYFDNNGQYTKYTGATINITNFKIDSSTEDKTTSSINTNYPLSANSIGLSEYYAEDLVGIINDVNHEKHNIVIKDISIGISTKLATSIKLSEMPVYNITARNYDYDKYPTSVLIDVQFSNNYFKDGQFITTGVLDATVYTIEISNLKVKGTTSISPIIEIGSEFKTADGILPLASEVAKANDDGTATLNIDKIKDLIYQNIVNKIETPEANRTKIKINGIESTLTNSGISDTGGINYFGNVNDYTGIISIKIVFVGGTWTKDGELQTVDSDEISIQLTGFRKLEHKEKWYNDEITLNTAAMISNVGNNVANALVFDNQDNTKPSWVTDEMIKDGIILDIEKIKTNFENALKYSALLLPSISSDFPWDNLKVDYSKNIADNANGTLVIKLSVFGENVYDPETGLIYNDQSNPYEFEVLAYGFNKVKQTVHNTSIYIDQVSNIVPPADVDEIYRQISNETNIRRIFSDTLPTGFYNAISDKKIKEWICIPNKVNNTMVDYANGSLTISELGLSYYYDENLILHYSKYDAGLSSLPTDIEQFKINNLKISGYAISEATEIKPIVSFAEYSNFTAQEFYESIINKDIVHGLIYNNASDEDNGNVDLPSINNLSKFLENYSVYLTEVPTMTVDESTVEFNNIDGTLSFTLKLTGNYFEYNSDGTLTLVKSDGNLTGKVTIYGFKKISSTSITSKININELVGGTTDSELLKNRKDLFWYDITDEGTNNEYNSTKYKILRLILDNHSVLIKNGFQIEDLLGVPINSDPNKTELQNQIDYLDTMSKYIEINITDAREQTNFSNGTLTIPITLKQFVASNGDIITPTSSEDPKSVLNTEITITGFNLYQTGTYIKKETSCEFNGATIDSAVEINKNLYDGLKDLQFSCTTEQIKDAFLNTTIDPISNKPKFINDLFGNVPPSSIFNYKDDKGLVDFSIEDNGAYDRISSSEHNPTPYISVKVTLKNVLVKNGSKITIGDKEFYLKITGFPSNMPTEIEETWDLSLQYGSYVENFKPSSTNVDWLKDGFMQFVNGNKNEPLWSKFIKNPVRLDGDVLTTTLERFENINFIPSEGKATATVVIRGYYNENNEYVDGEKSLEINILGFEIQSPTQIGLETFKLQEYSQTIDLLPSQLKYATETEINSAKTSLVTILNSESIKRNIFLNPVKDDEGNITTEIVSINNIVHVDDGSGTIRLTIQYINYYDETGNINIQPKESKEIIISGFNQASITTLGSTKIEIDEFFKGFSMPSYPANFPNMTPTQYIKELNRALELIPKEQQLEKFNEMFAQLIAPVYTGTLNNSDNPAPFSTAAKTNLATTGIVNLGKVQTWEKDEITNKFKLTPSKGDFGTQDISTILTSIDYHFSKDDEGGLTYNINDIIRPNDRLGELTFTLLLKGFWHLEYKEPTGDVVLNTTYNISNEAIKKTEISLYGGSENGSIQKDIANETNLTTVAIIVSSSLAALIGLIILIAFILKLVRFGTGGS